jgi:hypothetical protein
VERGLARLQALAEGEELSAGRVPWEALFEGVLGDDARCEDERQLPDTGMPPEVEHAFSSVFVEPFSHLVSPPATARQVRAAALPCALLAWSPSTT